MEIVTGRYTQADRVGVECAAVLAVADVRDGTGGRGGLAEVQLLAAVVGRQNVLLVAHVLVVPR